MEHWGMNNNWLPAQSGPGAVASLPSNPAAAAAPTLLTPIQVVALPFSPPIVAVGLVVAVAPVPAANGAWGLHRCPHCRKMGTHRPEECRSAPQNISMAGITVTQISFGAGATATDFTNVLSRMGQPSSRAWRPHGVKNSRRRRGRKPGKKTNDAGPRPEDKDLGAGSTGGGDGTVPV